MRHFGVSASAWMINIAAAVIGFVVWLMFSPPRRVAVLAALSIAAIALPFAFEGMQGVHRWVSLGGVRLHASAIVAPLIIWCVAASPTVARALAIGAGATLILALQPDAAQAVSLAAACAVVMARSRVSVAVLIVCAAMAFVRHDPLPPVAHVEGMFALAASRGAVWAVMAFLALALLPMPFVFAEWRAMGVYVVMTLLAPLWGVFPVPVLGYGASPILGYFVALAIGARARKAQRRSIESFD